MDQTQSTRYILRFEPLLYILAFTWKDFHYTSTQDFLHREPPMRIWQIQLGVPNSSLQQHNLYTRGMAQQLSPLIRGIRLKTKQQPQSPLHLEGYQHNFHTQLYTRGNSNKRRFTTFGGLTKTQTNFSHKTRS